MLTYEHKSKICGITFECWQMTTENPLMKFSKHLGRVCREGSDAGSLKVEDKFCAYAACLKWRNSESSEISSLSTLKNLQEIARDSDRLVTI